MKEGIYVAGIPSWKMNQVYASQKKDKWCWSASISMVLDSHDLAVSQEVIARDICGVDFFGNSRNCPASPFQISRSINVNGTDALGRNFRVIAPLRKNRPDIFALINELKNDRPVIVAYYNPDFKSSHAIVITGCKFIVKNGVTYLTKLYVRDPWKTSETQLTNGRRVIGKVDAFFNVIHSYWYIQVQKQQNYLSYVA